MRKTWIKRGLCLILALVAAVFMDTPVKALAGGTVNVSLLGKYDSADTAAIRSIDLDAKLIRFRNHATGKTYTLSYDNTSMMYDERGVVLSPSLLEPGEIVNVTFLKSSKHITTLDESTDAWTVDNVRDHELVRGDGTARVLGETYKMDLRTLVMADDAPALAEDVLSTDQIKVCGIGKEIYSVVVTGGHGYVSLSSDIVEDRSLVGAWLELDNEVIHKISPNMLLSAPEGDYTLQILGNGASLQQEVNISRNQETVVDTGNVKITKPKEGLVTFEITPDTAEVFVDGEKMLTGVSQSVQYGYHNLKVMADGYETQNKYLKVGSPKSVVRIELEKEKSAEASSSSSSGSANGTANADSAASKRSLGVSSADVGNLNKSSSAASTGKSGKDVSGNSSGDNKPQQGKVIKDHKIYFDAPSGAELYFDGSYIGMVPTHIVKVSGTHEVILKKDGYKTKSYRINIDEEETDLNYTFPDLVKEDSGSSKDSGNKDKDKDKDKEKENDGEMTGDDGATEATTNSGADATTTPAPSEKDDEGTDTDSKPGDDDTDNKDDKDDKEDTPEDTPNDSNGGANSNTGGGEGVMDGEYIGR